MVFSECLLIVGNSGQMYVFLANDIFIVRPVSASQFQDIPFNRIKCHLPKSKGHKSKASYQSSELLSQNCIRLVNKEQVILYNFSFNVNSMVIFYWQAKDKVPTNAFSFSILPDYTHS